MSRRPTRTAPGWNYMVRLYRPTYFHGRKNEFADGRRKVTPSGHDTDQVGLLRKFLSPSDNLCARCAAQTASVCMNSCSWLRQPPVAFDVCAGASTQLPKEVAIRRFRGSAERLAVLPRDGGAGLL